MTAKDAWERHRILHVGDHTASRLLGMPSGCRRSVAPDALPLGKALRMPAATQRRKTVKFCAPKRRRALRPTRGLWLNSTGCACFPSCVKDKIHVWLRLWGETEGNAFPSTSTLCRILSRIPDKMRNALWRIGACGRVEPTRCASMRHDPAHVHTQPRRVLATDAIEASKTACTAHRKLRKLHRPVWHVALA